MIGRGKRTPIPDSWVFFRQCPAECISVWMRWHWKSHLVREVAESLTLRNPAHLVFLAQGSEINRIQDIISSFGRNLHPSNRIPHPLLNEFGRKLGEEIIQTESKHRIDNTRLIFLNPRQEIRFGLGKHTFIIGNKSFRFYSNSCF